MLMYRDLANANKSFAHYGASYGADAQTSEQQRRFPEKQPVLTAVNSPRSRWIRSQDDEILLSASDNVLPLSVPHEEERWAVSWLDLEISIWRKEEQTSAPERQGHGCRSEAFL
jgi:hypothetical protein